ALIASRHFSVLLEQMPTLAYGHFTLGAILASQFQRGIYRGFVVSFQPRFDAYVAQPVFLGAPQPRALGPLLSRRRRLLGLLVMRVHLARQTDPGADAVAGVIADPTPLTPQPYPALRKRSAQVITRLRGWTIQRLASHMRFGFVADTERGLHAQIDQ